MFAARFSVAGSNPAYPTVTLRAVSIHCYILESCQQAFFYLYKNATLTRLGRLNLAELHSIKAENLKCFQNYTEKELRFFS